MVKILRMKNIFHCGIAKKYCETARLTSGAQIFPFKLAIAMRMGKLDFTILMKLPDIYFKTYTTIISHKCHILLPKQGIIIIIMDNENNIFGLFETKSHMCHHSFGYKACSRMVACLFFLVVILASILDGSSS